jgi:hypothetical protein
MPIDMVLWNLVQENKAVVIRPQSAIRPSRAANARSILPKVNSRLVRAGLVSTHAPLAHYLWPRWRAARCNSTATPV